MTKEKLEKVLEEALSTGGDFAEVFYEKFSEIHYILENSKIDRMGSINSKGIGLRLAKGKDKVFGSIDDPNDEKVLNLVKKLNKSFNDKRQITKVNLNDEEYFEAKIKIPHNKYDNDKKIALLKEIDNLTRKKSDKVTQVKTNIAEINQEVLIANSNGKLVREKRVRTRINLTVYLEDNGKKVSHFNKIGKSIGYEILDEFDIEKFVDETLEKATGKLTAKTIEGGKMPVILGNGFGAVIFHEACGHGLEATSVANDLSVFCNLVNKKIASSKVTLIDDGTIPNLWGTNYIDDEGNRTKKNVLIENGILKEYLVDELNSRKMNQKSNGASRRESHNLAPTSRMSNTYLKPGNDKIEDMVKSIKYGIYAKDLSGGSVNPTTGDFNFAVEVAYLIEDGKITDQLEGVSLIGNSLDILKNVEMVASDLEYSDGYCGSTSGTIPVTIGQPTIKVTEILVGGSK